MQSRRGFLAAGAALSSVWALPALGAGSDWETLVYGPSQSSLSKFTANGQGDWHFVDQSLEGPGDAAPGWLVTRKHYADFELRGEIWTEADASACIFLRCQDAQAVSAATACAINLCDGQKVLQRANGPVNAIAGAVPAAHLENRWNVVRVRAKGAQVEVMVNGKPVLQTQDRRFQSGAIALMTAGADVRFRRLHVRAV